MRGVQWATEHWLDLLQSVGIIGGLLFTALSLRIDAKVRRVANLLTITEHHRAIWTRLHDRPELSRVIKPAADLKRRPITDAEELFVMLVVLHLSSAQQAMKQGMFASPEGLRNDIRRFFSWPIPNEVWQRIKGFQDGDFVAFIENSLAMD